MTSQLTQAQQEPPTSETQSDTDPNLLSLTLITPVT